MTKGLCSSSKVNLRLTDFRITSIAYTLCKNSCHLTFVAIFFWREALDMLDKFYNLSVIYNTHSAGWIIFKVLKLAIAVEYHNVEK